MSCPKGEPTRLEACMCGLMKVFDDYAGADGSLSKAEVKTLLEKELPCMMKASKNPGQMDSFMKTLDFNGDAKVDFQEFAILVTGLTCACHDRCGKK